MVDFKIFNTKMYFMGEPGPVRNESRKASMTMNTSRGAGFLTSSANTLVETEPILGPYNLEVSLGIL